MGRISTISSHPAPAGCHAYFEKPENKDRQLIEIPGLLREASFIPETRSIDTLFKEMQSNKIHMEIVVDEVRSDGRPPYHGGYFRRIVGNILDEYDEEEEFITAREDGSYLMSGLAPLEDVEEVLEQQIRCNMAIAEEGLRHGLRGQHRQDPAAGA